MRKNIISELNNAKIKLRLATEDGSLEDLTYIATKNGMEVALTSLTYEKKYNEGMTDNLYELIEIEGSIRATMAKFYAVYGVELNKSTMDLNNQSIINELADFGVEEDDLKKALSFLWN